MNAEAKSKVVELSAKDKSRFWSLVNKDGPLPDQSNPHYTGLSQCWTWLGSPQDGYGTFWLQGKSFLAHRIAFLLHHGSFPINGCACHRCDFGLCCNHEHIFDGTPLMNMQDKMSKGRNIVPSGDGHYARLNPSLIVRGELRAFAKLNPEKVVEIRHRYKNGESLYVIAPDFGVSPQTVYKIVTRQKWKHVA